MGMGGSDRTFSKLRSGSSSFGTSFIYRESSSCAVCDETSSNDNIASSMEASASYKCRYLPYDFLLDKESGKQLCASV